MTATQPRQTTSTPNGRSTDGRFATGNAGGPGNPFYCKQAEFRRAVLELFTPEEVMSLLRVMLALGRNGDVAAAKGTRSQPEGDRRSDANKVRQRERIVHTTVPESPLNSPRRAGPDAR
jgi:hypothetical protein